jgi:hypothetical protein
MQGQCWLVNGSRFLGRFSALRCAKSLNAFDEFHIPEWHYEAWESVDVQKTMNKEPTHWIDQKIDYLFEKYPKQRLWFSGGTDSDTILKRSLARGHLYEHVFMQIRGLKDFDYVEFDVKPGYEWLHANQNVGRIVEFQHNTAEDYAEVWADPEIYINCDDFAIQFYPSWRSLSLRHTQYELDIDLNVEGHLKPVLYCKDGHYYWLHTDGFSEGRKINANSFFMDGEVPEVAISQLYSARNFFKKYTPNLEGTLGQGKVPMGQRTEYHLALGRLQPRSKEISIGTLGNAKGVAPVNSKQIEAMLLLEAAGRTDIIHNFFATMQRMITEFQDMQYGITIEYLDNPLKNIHGEFDYLPDKIPLPQITSRISHIYRLDDTEMVKVPVDGFF